MRVVYSPDMFRIQRYGGVSRYYAELLKGLRARGVDAEAWAGLHINQLIRGLPGVRGIDVGRLRPHSARQALTRGVDLAASWWWMRSLDPSDLYHLTYFLPAPRPAGPLVVTVYDMLHERYPHEFARRDRTAQLKRHWCQQADLVLAISDTTREDLLERIPLDPQRVVTTPLGVRRIDPDPRVRPPVEPFILYVGERRPQYKGFATVVEALRALPQEVRLVCFGGGPPRDDERAALAERGVALRVSFHVGDDAALASYLRASVALIYPSRYEGFGLPPLEAMVQDCPVVVADTPALVETTGGAALRFPPADAEALAAAVIRVTEDMSLRTALIDAGRTRTAELTWDATVERTLAAYRTLCPRSEEAVGCES